MFSCLDRGFSVFLAFWPFIKDFLSPSELQRYYSMSTIVTDSGRCELFVLYFSIIRLLFALVVYSLASSWNFAECSISECLGTGLHFMDCHSFFGSILPKNVSLAMFYFKSYILLRHLF